MYSFYTNLVEAYNLHNYAPNAYGIATNLVFKLVKMVGCLFELKAILGLCIP
jgi:hypothetical protein